MMNQKKPNQILLVEDEASIADNIRFACRAHNVDVDWVQLGQVAIDQFQSKAEYDLVVLDIGLPDITGFEVCKAIRNRSQVPIIFLTARNDEIDKVLGLELGGDDYMEKPFSPRELVARIQSNIRRYRAFQPSAFQPSDNGSEKDLLKGNQDFNDFDASKATQFANQKPIFIGDWYLDRDAREIKLHSMSLDLTRYEYGLLELFLTRPKVVFSREKILETVWQEPENSLDRVVDTHIKTIRQKISDIDSTKDYIRTHRGIGYSFNLSPKS